MAKLEYFFIGPNQPIRVLLDFKWQVTLLRSLRILHAELIDLKRDDYFLSIDIDRLMQLHLLASPGLPHPHKHESQAESQDDERPGPEKFLFCFLKFLINHFCTFIKL